MYPSPAEITATLRKRNTGGHVDKRSWERLIAFATGFDTVLRHQFAHLWKFPTQLEVENWWTKRALYAAGLENVNVTSQVYVDVESWAADVADTVLQ